MQMQTLGPESIERTSHDLRFYQRYFGSDLGVADELVVDLGAGDTSIAGQIQGSRVVRVDFDYGARPPVNRRNAIAAWAQALPFADSSVDKMISNSMFLYLTADEAAQVAMESLRVLRPGGRLVFDAQQKPVGEQPHELELWKVRRMWSLRHDMMLGVTKPLDYKAWPEDRRAELCKAIGLIVASSDAMIAFGQTEGWKRFVRRLNDKAAARRTRLEQNDAK